MCSDCHCVTWGMHRACVEDKWRSGAATGWRCSLKMSSAASACSCRCHWVFTEAPLFPTSLPCQTGEKKKSRQALDACTFDLTWAPLLRLLPAIILLLLRSCQKFRGLRLSALVPRSSRLSPGSFIGDGRRHRRRRHPKSGLSQAAATIALQGLQWIRDAFFLFISGHWSFIPHC